MAGRRSTRTSAKSAGLSGKMALRLSAAALTVLLVVLGAIQLHYRSFVRAPVLEDGEKVTLVIPKNTAWPQVVRILVRERLVERPTYFEYWARRHHLPRAVKAGTYELTGPLGLDGLANALREGGRFDETSVTFPEGLTIFHMADRLDEMGLVSREGFLRAARDKELLAEFGLKAHSFEGYLFPDTYRFRKGTTAADIVRKLHGRWQAVWLSLSQEYPKGLAKLAEVYDFDRHDVVTLASIVERETSLASEMSVIARVFLNRLDRDMRLQTDPTCVYAEDTYDQVPNPKLCKDALNRYSTYVIDGLPPGPISNPGKQSMAAALEPSAKKDAKRYLFFVARRDGTHRHYFSETFAEHRRAIRRFLK